jgi:hypothetical protein
MASSSLFAGTRKLSPSDQELKVKSIGDPGCRHQDPQGSGADGAVNPEKRTGKRGLARLFPVTGFDLAEANFSREAGKSIRHCKFAGDLISGCMLIFERLVWILFLMRGTTDGDRC